MTLLRQGVAIFVLATLGALLASPMTPGPSAAGPETQAAATAPTGKHTASNAEVTHLITSPTAAPTGKHTGSNAEFTHLITSPTLAPTGKHPDSNAEVTHLITSPTVPDLGTSTRTQEHLKEASLSARWAECFQAAGLTPFPTSLTCNTNLLVHHSLMAFWTHHASFHMCQKREAYGDVMACVLEATKSCLPPEHRLHFPDNKKARQGLYYICNVGEADTFDVNITCAYTHFPEVFNCIHRDTQLVVANSAPAHLQLICSTFDIADLCSWETLQVCGAETAGAYTRMMSLYFRPPSCSTSAAETAAYDRWILSVLTLAFSVLLW